MFGSMVVKPIVHTMIMANKTRTKLIYVMGASGVGKDSLLNYAQEHGSANDGYVFAHRYITRPADSGGENHIALTEEEFQQRARHHCFAMRWQSHGNEYGVGTEIDQWLQQGLNVVVNGSRAYFNTAVEQYPSIVPVLITADKHRLLTRLTKRGRESQEAIEKRLQKTEAIERTVKHPSLVVIENNGELAAAGDGLIQLLKSIDRATSSLHQDLNKNAKLSIKQCN